MATISFQWRGEGIARMAIAMERLAGPRRVAALRRAINHTGDKTFTLTKRTLTKQMGLKTQQLLKNGRVLRKIRAYGSDLQYEIVSSGRAVRLKEFPHRATRKGVSAAPWGRRRLFRSSFIIARYSNGVYRRRTNKRFPIAELYGPNINKELVKDATAHAFQEIVARELPKRFAHEIKVITNGVVT